MAMTQDNSYAIQGCQGCTVVKVASRNEAQEAEKNRHGGGGQMADVNYWPKNLESSSQHPHHHHHYHPQFTVSKSCVREWSDDANGALNKSTSALDRDPRMGDGYSKGGILVQNGVPQVNGGSRRQMHNGRTVNFDPGVWHSPQLANNRHRMRDTPDRLKSATLSPPTSRHLRNRQQNGGFNADRTMNECKPLLGYKHVILESPIKTQTSKGEQQQQQQGGGGYEAAKRILSGKVVESYTDGDTNTIAQNVNSLGPVHSPLISRRDEKGKKNKSPLAYSQRVSGYRLANGYVNVTISPAKLDTIQLRVKDSTTPMSPSETRKSVCTAPTCNISTGYDRSTVAKPAVPPRTSSLSTASHPCHRSIGNLDSSGSSCSGSSTTSGDSAVPPENSTTPLSSTHRCQSSGCPLLAAQRWIQQQRKPQPQPASLPSPSGLSHSSLGFCHPSSPYGNGSELHVLGAADTSRDSGFVSIGEEFTPEQHTYIYKGAEQVTHFCRLLHQPPVDTAAPPDQQPLSPGKPLTESQRLRKVIKELIETERQYVKDLNCLIERYLEPLKEETYLSGEDIELLFGNIQEIVQFQRLFLQSLEEAVEIEPNFSETNDPNTFRDENLRRILFSLGGSFLYYANHFKLYSSFCAAHSKAQKVLNPEENEQLAEFLRARNPKQQHSSTLESYLIKPIQRILKYPLLLRQLKDLTDSQSDEHQHLTEALRGMEAVAEHINEMQKIYEEYGNVFDDLIRLYKDSHRMAIDLNVGELQMYGNVNWLNALDELGKIKKGTELVTMLFVFKTGVVILAQERCKAKKQKAKPSSGSGSDTAGAGGIGEVIRFQAAIRVDQLQVRSVVNETSERHGLWELVHCRSEKEGRPETIFQFASSQEAKRDFIKTIHNTIRESVRRMSIPGPRSTLPRQQQHQQQSPNSNHIPNGGAGNKRPDTLPGPPSSSTPSPQGNSSSSSASVGKKKGKLIRGELGVRHSMDIDDKMMESSIGTRSRTLTDLNKMDLTDGGGYPSGSQSTIASEASRSSARLLHASNTPHNYSAATSTTTKEKDGLGSPIWKPRHAGGGGGGGGKKVVVSGNRGQHHHQYHHPSSIEERQEYHPVVSGVSSVYGDYSNIVYDDKNTSAAAAAAASVMMQHPNAYVEYEDTDC